MGGVTQRGGTAGDAGAVVALPSRAGSEVSSIWVAQYNKAINADSRRDGLRVARPPASP